MTADLVLLAFALAVALFTGAAWCRLMVLLREDARERQELERWLEGRRKYREESSLADDSSALREEPKEAA